MKVLVADSFEQSGIDGLKAAGCDVVYRPDLKDDTLTQALSLAYTLALSPVLPIREVTMTRGLRALESEVSEYSRLEVVVMGRLRRRLGCRGLIEACNA